MLILGLDTSSSTGSVALRDKNGVCGLLNVSVDTTHSEGLMPAIDVLFERTQRSVDDLTAIACIKGPGSYTGLRIGIATAQGFAFGKNLACFSFTSLEMLAWSLPHCRYPVCPVVAARKGWVYAQIFSWNKGQPVAVTEELYVQPEQLIDFIKEPTVFYGPGLAPYKKTLQGILQEDGLFVSSPFNLPRADCLTEMAYRELQAGNTLKPHEMQPHYLGPSQAEINWKKLHPKP